MSAQTNCSSNSDKGTYTAEIGIGFLIIFISFRYDSHSKQEEAGRTTLSWQQEILDW